MPADQETTPPALGNERTWEADARLVGNFNVSLHPLQVQSRRMLHELTLSVRWPHRDQDLALFLSLGRGYVALDRIGRALGSAMYFPSGDDFAMFGMMVTVPRLQAQGAGRWLLQRIMEDCAGRDLRLSATRDGYWLYERSGFVPAGTIWQHQGTVRSAPSELPERAGLSVRSLSPEDRGALLTLDRHAYGARREAMLDALLQRSEQGLLALRDGRPAGYALMRRFGRGRVIGPIVSEDEDMAMRLSAPLIATTQGAVLRVDTPLPEGPFRAMLEAAGLGLYSTVTEMFHGRQRRAQQGPQIMGLASHSLG